MKDDQCIFCKLANGDIPTNIMYEDDWFTVIMDASPVTKGHALILPKTHAANLEELPDEYASKVLVLAKKLAARLRQVLKCDGLNVMQNNGPVAGQSVFHFHLHLIPRYQGDGHAEKLCWTPAGLSPEEITQVCDQLKA